MRVCSLLQPVQEEKAHLQMPKAIPETVNPMPFHDEIHQNDRAVEILANSGRLRAQPPPNSDRDRPPDPVPPRFNRPVSDESLVNKERDLEAVQQVNIVRVNSL